MSSFATLGPATSPITGGRAFVDAESSKALEKKRAELHAKLKHAIFNRDAALISELRSLIADIEQKLGRSDETAAAPNTPSPMDPVIHRAAGILFVTTEGKALFLKRGSGGDMPGDWCFPGGTTEGDENPEQTALREAKEELGDYPKGDIRYHTRGVLPVITHSVDFTTFVQLVKEEFVPTLNGEHTGYAWAPLGEPPEPLHPGCWIAIRRFAMDELGVARAMMAGELTSPQLYGNVNLFDMRITGTGVAFRNAKRNAEGEITQREEFVYRRPENYLTEEFLARCNGLQVIMMHPPGAVLDSKEFAARTVGAMMLPYIKGDEVWGIAKIYDDEAVTALTSSQMSTSPGVVLGFGGDQRFTTEDGTPLLVEGKPSLLDHLAICERGVWDKGGEPSGVRTDNQGDMNMLTEDDKKVLDERIASAMTSMMTSLPALMSKAVTDARTDDAGTGSKIDKVLGALETFGKRLDTLEVAARKDSDDKDKKADAACYSGRMDSDTDESFMKRHDAEEAKAKADAMARGDSEEEADKKAKEARKDAEEDDKKKRADSDKAKADADEAAKKKADAALTVENAELRNRLAAVEKALPKQITDDDRHEFGKAQARADEVYSAFGKRAPFALNGEDVFSYRRRLAVGLKMHSPTWKDVDVLKINDSATFSIAETAILLDAVVAARNPTDLKAGELRAITRVDNNTGVRTTEFVGQQSFIHGMKRQPRYVKRIGASALANA